MDRNRIDGIEVTRYVMEGSVSMLAILDKAGWTRVVDEAAFGSSGSPTAEVHATAKHVEIVEQSPIWLAPVCPVGQADF